MSNNNTVPNTRVNIHFLGEAYQRKDIKNNFVKLFHFLSASESDNQFNCFLALSGTITQLCNGQAKPALQKRFTKFVQEYSHTNAELAVQGLIIHPCIAELLLPPNGKTEEEKERFKRKANSYVPNLHKLTEEFKHKKLTNNQLTTAHSIAETFMSHCLYDALQNCEAYRKELVKPVTALKDEKHTKSDDYSYQN